MAWSNPKKPYEHVGYCSLSDTPGMAMVTNFKKGDPIIFFLSISFHLFVMDFSQIWASQAGRAKAGFSQVRALDNLLEQRICARRFCCLHMSTSLTSLVWRAWALWIPWIPWAGWNLRAGVPLDFEHHLSAASLHCPGPGVDVEQTGFTGFTAFWNSEVIQELKIF